MLCSHCVRHKYEPFHSILVSTKPRREGIRRRDALRPRDLLVNDPTVVHLSSIFPFRHRSIVPHLYQSDKSPESRTPYDKWTSGARGEKNKLSSDYLHQRFPDTKAVFCVQVRLSFRSPNPVCFSPVYFVMTVFLGIDRGGRTFSVRRILHCSGDARLFRNFSSRKIDRRVFK